MKKVDCMRRWLIRCCYWYYVKADPLISDYHFDLIFKELEAREKRESNFDPESPTQIIYGDLEEQYPEWAKKKTNSMEICTE